MKSKLTLMKDGKFTISDVNHLSYTYFPLCNTKALKSSISPNLGGDATIDHNSFILPPTTVEDLDNSLLKRNVFFRINDNFTWSITGQTPTQILTPDKVDLHGDFLIHKIIRKHELFSCAIESFVPSSDVYQELHKITLENTSKEPLEVKTVTAVPIYGRSADSLRDHRQVTSLLNRVKIIENGLINHPTFSFDERGHIVNRRQYGVFASTSHHDKVKAFYPTVEEFTGEGHTLLDPVVVKENVVSSYKVGDVITGFEVIAGLEYETVTLKQGESLSIVLSLAISDDDKEMEDMASSTSLETFEKLKEETRNYWHKELSQLTFNFPNESLNGWLKWVTLQPILRRIYGNSFLPYHDYGRGGRGWRDLWQDLLALILMNPASVRDMLVNNFKGIRIDGSNATIIGDKPGVFIADRNNIARIWMDHGSWPLLTTILYLNQSGDFKLLFEETTYFQDQFTHYTKRVNKELVSKENLLKTHNQTVYNGTILEHLIIQNLVPYFNVGEHNTIRLEDADWNDGLDMANKRGESVAFTSFYGQNLISLSELLKKAKALGINQIELFEEIETLIASVNQSDIKEKNQRLEAYFLSVESGVSGKKTIYDANTLAECLFEKGMALLKQVRDHEWLEEGNEGWFNGYYDNDALPLDDVLKKHMTLTGQVFSIMSEAATDEQVKKIVASADKYLYLESVGGYRLNTDFKEVKTNMGRLFGFAYGHKENGAMFSHMAVMYANALYKRGFVKEGYKVIHTIYKHSMDLEHAKMYPGIPEYFNPRGRGMYPYLTGSASWFILTLITEMFGVKSDMGLPVFEPKVLLEQFQDETELKIETVILDKVVEVTYQNPLRLEFGNYKIGDVWVDNEKVSWTETKFGVKLTEKIIGKSVIIELIKK